MTRWEIIDRVFPRFGLFVLLIAGSFLAGGAEHALANVPASAAFCLYLMIPVFRELRAAGELRRFLAACVRIAAWGVPILCGVLWLCASLAHLQTSTQPLTPTVVAEPNSEVFDSPIAEETPLAIPPES